MASRISLHSPLTVVLLSCDFQLGLRLDHRLNGRFHLMASLGRLLITSRSILHSY